MSIFWISRMLTLSNCIQCQSARFEFSIWKPQSFIYYIYSQMMSFSCLVDALKCWGCISTLKRECGEPFVSSKLHKLDYRECAWKCGTLVFNNSEGKWILIFRTPRSSLSQNWVISIRERFDLCELRSVWETLTTCSLFRFFFHFLIFEKGIKSWYRFCAENQQDLEGKCKDMDQISCNTCETDGCNTAANFGSIALFVVIPIAIAKLFLHFVP